MPKKNLADAKNPLTILFKILANALLEDESGIDGTAFNALLLLGELIDKELLTEYLQKRVREENGRYRFDD
jgi:hypothetical protein